MTDRVLYLLLCVLGGAGLVLSPGCTPEEHQLPMTGENPTFMTDQRLSNGLVIVLPGIEGESSMNQDVRYGLTSAGVDQAVPIHRWGSPLPGVSLLINQMNVIGNRIAAKRLADMIVAYQDTHPGKPVHIVGHSGGGGVAVFTAEALPPGRQIEGLVLLSASISSAYDCGKALAKCRKGILNFYCRNDGLLVIGTLIAGNVDGIRGPGAGAVGFDKTYPKLEQREITAEAFGDDPHAAATRSGFVARNVAPWILSGR